MVEKYEFSGREKPLTLKRVGTGSCKAMYLQAELYSVNPGQRSQQDLLSTNRSSTVPMFMTYCTSFTA